MSNTDKLVEEMMSDITDSIPEPRASLYCRHIDELSSRLQAAEAKVVELEQTMSKLIDRAKEISNKLLSVYCGTDEFHAVINNTDLLIIDRLIKALERSQKLCEWTIDNDGDNVWWSTTCEMEFDSIESSKQSSYNYCPGCGGKIIEPDSGVHHEEI